MSRYYVVEEFKGPDTFYKVVGPSGTTGPYERILANTIASSNSEAFREGEQNGARLIVGDFVPVLAQMRNLLTLGDIVTVITKLQELVTKLGALLE